MPVGFQNLYFSSDPSALETSFISAIAFAKKKDPLQTIHVLIPNHYVGSHLKHKLAEQLAILNIRFCTFENLARHILQSDKTFLSKIHMTPEIEMFQIGNIAEKVLQGSIFGTIGNKRGFHQNLKKLFHHLIQHGAKKIPPINDKIKSFDQIFQKYLDLKKKYYNKPWLIEASAGSTTKSEISSLCIFGITQFTPLEMRFLNQLSEHTEINLWIERPFFEDLQEEIFTWAGDTFEHSEEVSAGKNADLVVQPAAHLQDEAEWISQTIVEQQKSKPLPFHRFGIFLNDFEKQRTYIEHSFQQYQIPYVICGGRPLTSTPIGKALQILAEVLFQNWKRDAWIWFLQSFPFKPSIYESCGTPDQWNEWTIKAQITNKNTFLIQRLEQLNKSEKNPKLQAFTEWMRTVLSSLERVEKSFYKNAPAFFKQWFEWVQTYADPTSIRDEHAIFFDDLIYFSQNMEEIEWTDLKSVIQEKLQSPAVQDQVFESDGVFVAPVSTLPGLTFDTIFQPYTNEGAFPKPAPQPFDLTSQEMFLITQKSGVSFPSSERDFETQRILFETTKSRTNHFFISYSQTTLPNQEELRPSVFLQETMKEKPFSKSWTPKSENPDPVFTQNVRKYQDSIQNNTWSTYNALITDPADKTVYSARDVTTYLTCPRQYYLSQVLRVFVDEFPENHFQVDPKDKGTLVHEILFEVFSRLKDENLFPLNTKNESAIMNIAKTVANETFDRFVLSHAYGSEEMWKIDREELLNDITLYMKHEIREGKYWIPYALEYRFGMGHRGGKEDPLSTEKTVTLPVLQKQMNFRGKVDRIDLSPDKQQMRIVDYKTGQFSHVNWNYKKGTELQVPLYMMLSKHFFPDIQPQRTEGALVQIKSFSKFDRRVLPHETLSNSEEKILELLDLAGAGIKQGKFYPNPGYSRSNCKLCDFQAFCGEHIDRDIESIPADEFMDEYKMRKDALK